MDTTALSNLLAYSTQLACIVLVATLLPPLLRLDAPGVRYGYWRAVAALCLVLPWLQGRHLPAVSAGTVSVTAGASFARVAAARPATSTPSIDWLTVALVILAAGIALRLIWIGAGLVQLRALRSAGAPAPPSEVIDELQRVIGTRAEIRYVPGLGQPVTFGAIRPVVLLPETLLDQPLDVQRAVLGHELFHVQRRDWAWILLEELGCAVLWFNPAVWWLISRVQLAREEVVDELAVLLTGHRRTYVEALLAFAARTPLAPAPAFARRRHLFRRVMLISREVAMSSRRVVASCAVMALVVGFGSWYAVSAFPLVGGPQQTLQKTPGPLEQKAVPITPENPVPRRVVAAPAEYPAEAAAQDATGSVTLLVTVDQQGQVAETRVTAFRVRTSALQMDFSGVRPEDLDRRVGTFAPEQLATARPVLDAFIKSAVTAVEQWRYDAPYQGPISFPITISLAPKLSGGAGGAGSQGATGRVSFTADGAVRVGGNIRQPTKIKDVRPVYPPIAQTARVSGVVIVEARIEGDGRVSQARVLRSIPLLDQAALDAVTQWEFQPTLMNGVPVPVIMTLTVNFTLN